MLLLAVEDFSDNGRAGDHRLEGSNDIVDAGLGRGLRDSKHEVG